MSTADVSQSEVEELVRGIVAGADLSQMTGKVVREKVIELLGERAGDDERALKKTVRDALRAVLASPDFVPPVGLSEQEANPNQENTANVTTNFGGNQETHLRNGSSEATAQNEAKNVLGGNANASTGDREARGGQGEVLNLYKGEGLKDSEVDPTDETDLNAGMDLDVTGEHTNIQSEPNAPNEEDPDHDADDEDEDFASPDKNQVVTGSTKKRKKMAVAESDEESDEQNDQSETQKKSISSGRAQPAKRARKPSAATSKYLERLKSICRQLGCNVGPKRLRGKTVPEQISALVEHLSQKGVSNPTSLTKKDIAIHRARIEKDAELAALDTSNIIEEGGRSRRSRKTQGPKPSAELPSDFSGPELSEASSQDDDEDEYKASSDDSE